ncbi:ComF family protein [Nitrincola alkalilacustris]|uniref:ComF family protein n=1 Tax=Nitrincola alkalilacustris TaxID=1571224 RepID=UPI00124F674C|nr:ComF family protein [Nitrincola alkalilacustris]
MFKIKVYNRLFINQPCRLCASPLALPNGLCEACHADLPWLLNACKRCGLPLPFTNDSPCRHCDDYPSAIDRTLVPFHYQFPLNRLIPDIKYHKKPAALGWMSHVMAQYLESICTDMPELLIPVPMHRLNEARRGFNQSSLLAYQLSRHLQIPCDHRLLSKTRLTPRQMTLSAEQRRHNLKQAFAIHREPPEHVALIDDVMTTGSTADELAQLLKERGAAKVDLLVMARTPSPEDGELTENQPKAN